MTAPAPQTLILATTLVVVMGFAIQRGATCCVAAVDELMRQRRWERLRAMLLASAWVCAGLWLARQSGWIADAPSGYQAGWNTVLGGAMLGYGAYLNSACVFGAVARLGCGQWAYVLTFPGYLAGCWLFSQLPPSMVSAYTTADGLAPWALLAALALVAYSITRWWRDATASASANPTQAAPQRLWQWLNQTVWVPTAATTVIGLTFTGVYVLVGGAWAYIDVLADWALGRNSQDVWRGLLLLALFAGAMLGGWTAGRMAWQKPQPRQMLRCFLGGMFMGFGTLFIPGSNDGLILIGLPSLWPYAWLGFASMLGAIALAMTLEARLAARQH